MIGRIGSTLSAWARPALRLWARIPVRTQGRITVALPLVAVFVSACPGVWGNLERFDQASNELPAAPARLTELAQAEPGETPRADSWSVSRSSGPSPGGSWPTSGGSATT